MPGYDRGFESLTDEREAVELDVEGTLPSWLDGALIRNGPAQFEVDGTQFEHWFDGLAMLHRLAFDPEDDSVRYTNRFLRSDAYRAAQAGDLPSGFATAAQRGLLGRIRAFVLGEPPDNANVHVARLGGEYVALTETPRVVAFDPETLETTGHPDMAGTTLHHTVAHLRRDESAGETWGVGVTFGPRNRYRVFRIPDDTFERKLVASIPVSRPAYIHSFALTPRYVVLIEPPFTVDPVAFLLRGGAFIDHFEWDPASGTRILLLDRETGEVTERHTDALFTFHLVNAFERDDPEADGTDSEPTASGDDSARSTVVVDAVVYDDASIVADLELEGGVTPTPAQGRLCRFRVPTDRSATGDDVDTESLYDGIELPRFSPDVVGREYRYAYGQATRREGMNGLVKVDVETGRSWEWWEERVWAQEPVFVPDPDADREDAGVALALALDAEAERTVALVLDGPTFTERARVELPHVVPFGFHGDYFPDL